MSTNDTTGARCAELVQAARRSTGLSQVELARRCELPSGSLAHLEAGREPRSSTVASLLSGLPSLRVADLLGAGATGGPSQPAAWEASRELHGFFTQRLVREVDLRAGGAGSSRLEMHGLRCWPRASEDPEHRIALLRAVIPGPSAVARQLEPEALEPSRWEATEGPVRHEAGRPARERDGLHYVRTTTVDDDVLLDGLVGPDGRHRLVVEVLHPIERLDLVAWLPSTPHDPRCVAWPCAVGPDTPRDWARELHPRGVDLRHDAASGRLTLTLRRPTVGLMHGLEWSTSEGAVEKESPSPRGVGRRHRTDLATALSRARERSGLTQRQLARRMDVSPNTVSVIERGGDPRISVLGRALTALPELLPQDLLPQVSRSGRHSLDELWEHDHRLLGLAADELVKTVDIDDAGHSETSIVTRGLRSLRGDSRELEVRLGVWRVVLQDQPAVLQAIETDVEARARVVERELDRVVHRFTFPARAASTGLSYTRRFERVPRYVLTEERAAPHVDEPPPYFEGTTVKPTHPTRRLSIVVCFPEGYWPSEVITHAWPLVHVPGVGDEALEASLPRDRLVLTRDRRRRRVRLRIDRPPLGLQFGLSWRLPPR
ncbi:MAG: helix-turn-helix transcriptional regulator [Acidobacteriota bacterium]